MRRSFDEFVSSANRLSLHAGDWDRFYVLIRDAHRVSSPLLGIEIKVLLTESGFPDDVASVLASVYDHGTAIIRKYKGATLAYPGQHPHELRNEMRKLRGEIRRKLARYDAKQAAK